MTIKTVYICTRYQIQMNKNNINDYLNVNFSDECCIFNIM